MSPKLPKYKYLITYRLAEIIFDLVDAFILRYLSHLGNLSYLGLKEQILKCARSIKQNIIEGVSEVASLKSQIKLLGVAYASVEELIADLEDFLRRKNLALYPKNHPKIAAFRALGTRLSHLSNLSNLGHLKEKPALPNNLEEASNLILTLCHQLSFLLKRQIEATEKKFVHQGGYTENLFQKRISYRKLPKPPKSTKSFSSFTLMELLLIVALLALLVVLVLIFINPIKQIQKSHDSKRIHELSQLKKVLEDYYNDKNCYPKPEEVCYDALNNTCHICGNQQNSPSLSPYLDKLPCDPQSPKKDYLYQVDNADCPRWFRIYSNLDLSNKSINTLYTEELGCYYESCGLSPDFGYDYGVSSPNIDLERSTYFSYCSPTGCQTCTVGTNDQACFNFPNNFFCPGNKLIFGGISQCIANCPCNTH